uniref:Putative Mini-RNaseIII like protein n=1 Tax=Cunninghamia lanceolata TaxID=28977 RepID=A0A0R5QL20_CUNLA|nr:putative Mini-RNaseIII like protein [Cunninghamia lanceolata]
MAATVKPYINYFSSSCHLLSGYSCSSCHGRVVASWSLRRNTDAPKRIKIVRKRLLINDGKSEPIAKPKIDITQLLERSSHDQPVSGTLPAIHSDCQTWLPPAPNVAKPRSIYNAATLAYLGDCIYELYARRHFFFPPLSINEYNRRVMALVCCEAQEALLNKLLEGEFLSEEERDIIRWGKNRDSGKTRTVRRAGAAVYNRASSLETLVGYLYLTNGNRLDALMRSLGFCTNIVA